MQVPRQDDTVVGKKKRNNCCWSRWKWFGMAATLLANSIHLLTVFWRTRNSIEGNALSRVVQMY